MGAVVDNAVHVQIQIIELWNYDLMGQFLIDEGVPLR